MDKLTYKIDNRNQIIYKKLKGKLTINEIIEYFMIIYNDVNYNFSYKVLFDIRDAEIIADSVEEIQSLINYIKEVSESHLITHRIAVLTNTPNHVVYSELVRVELIPLLPIQFEIFSTYRESCFYLGVDC